MREASRAILQGEFQGPYKSSLPKDPQSHCALEQPTSCLRMDYTTRNVLHLL